MFKLWGKIVKDNTIIHSHVFESDESELDFKALLIKGIEDLCNRFDIGNPMWLNDNTISMNQINKTSFKKQHFIEEIDFDYFEIEYFEERV